MHVAREEEQERVSSELEHVAAAAIRDADQAFEDTADGEDELFRTRAALRLKSLCERSEAREVD